MTRLTLANVSSVGYLDSSKVFFYPEEEDDGGRKVDVTFDLSGKWGDEGYERELMQIVASELSPASLGEGRVVGPRFGRVGVKVKSEEEGWRLEEMVLENWRESSKASGVREGLKIEFVGGEEGKKGHFETEHR